MIFNSFSTKSMNDFMLWDHEINLNIDYSTAWQCECKPFKFSQTRISLMYVFYADRSRWGNIFFNEEQDSKIQEPVVSNVTFQSDNLYCYWTVGIEYTLIVKIPLYCNSIKKFSLTESLFKIQQHKFASNFKSDNFFRQRKYSKQDVICW